MQNWKIDMQEIIKRAKRANNSRNGEGSAY